MINGLDITREIKWEVFSNARLSHIMRFNLTTPFSYKSVEWEKMLSLPQNKSAKGGKHSLQLHHLIFYGWGFHLYNCSHVSRLALMPLLVK